MWKPNLVLYHGGCNDGFGAAWVITQRWPLEEIEFRAVAYGSEPGDDLRGRDVLMVDVTYTAAQLAQVGEYVGSMVILDHHKTAQEALATWRVGSFTHEGVAPLIKMATQNKDAPIIAHFDMDKSGVRLAWEFCFENMPSPSLVDYIEDHDLWRHKLTHSQEFAAALGSYPYDFAVWTRISEKGPSLSCEGKHILRHIRKNLTELMPYAVHVGIGGYSVPVLNLPFQWASLGGHALLEHYPQAHFAATWFNRGERDQWSLRSQGNRMDVGAMAKHYSGGGHRNAAGFHAPAGGAIAGKVEAPV